MDYYSAIPKKKKKMPFAATWIDLDTVIVSEVSQTEKEKYNVTSLMCGIYKDNTSELIYKTETDRQNINLWLPKRKVRRKDKLGG